MEVTGVFLLPPDAELVPVSQLPHERRETLSADDGDFALTRLRSRSQSKIIDADTARLLGQFKTKTTIVDAILRFNAEYGGDPEALLEAAYPILENLIQSELLVAEGSEQSEPVQASLAAGDDWAGLRIVRLVQILEDTELYEARGADGGALALKIARRAEAKDVERLLRREAGILHHLDGVISPRLIAHDVCDGRSFLASEWLPGVSGSRHATHWRSIQSSEGRRRLLEFCSRIADAYTCLHEQGVVHGDVHPGNIIVGNDESVNIIDFGLSRIPSSDDDVLMRAPRGGLGHYFEPEYAASFNTKTRLPQSSFSGEQHILAHFLYTQMTGHHYVQFSAEQKQGMLQLAGSTPEPFSRWGIEPWPDVEAALSRALSIDPEERYPAVADLADALRAAAVPATHDASPGRRTQSIPSDGRLADYLQRLDPGERLFEAGLPQAPYSSINYGSGGIAYFLYRLAGIRQDAELLSWAKLWIEKALSEADTIGEEAFCEPAGEITREVIGEIALYHTSTGLHATKALIGHAMADDQSTREALQAFARSTREAGDKIDLTLGQAGILLGSALLREAIPGHETIGSVGDRYFDLVFRQIEQMPPIGPGGGLDSTGIAHGWAGLLYALLLWCRSSGSPPPDGLKERLAQLAAHAENADLGIRWPVKLHANRPLGEAGYFPSWCNGTAGMIHLWTLAHDLLKEPLFASLAEGAAANIIYSRSRIDQLCCGRPGHAYGVLNLYKYTGEPRWLAHVKDLFEQARQLSEPPLGWEVPPHYYSLYKGPMGTALLSADLEKPQYACMPLFESEGWRN